MGYWGWRPLISALFICVWIIGCNIISGTAPILSPTGQPLVTLTLRKQATRAPSVTPTSPISATDRPEATPAASDSTPGYTVRPGDTLLGIALDFGLSLSELEQANPNIDPLALQVGQQLAIPQPGLAVAAVNTPVGLQLDPPVCYDMISGSTICLGKIVNTQRQMIRQVRVQVGLEDEEGNLVAEMTAGIDQRGIPPNEIAPYSVILKTRPYERATVSLLNGEVTALPADLVLLSVQDEQVDVVGRRYLVRATLQNRSDSAVAPPRLILTVLDEDGQVAGFRVLDLAEGLEAGARQIVTIDALTQTSGESLSHHLYAEAQRL